MPQQLVSSFRTVGTAEAQQRTAGFGVILQIIGKGGTDLFSKNCSKLSIVPTLT